ncbi:efflux RND transporter periplasmic adaptor subunit [Paenibacillus sp. NPDC058071]|uniref:efflux RND transporter periplasmic adaptor subunit n=1 Tax=Paenibacillus sp. NPDC058071 TaxID=3346326 RepID=UPI0036DA41D6
MKKKSTWILVFLGILIILISYLLFSLSKSPGANTQGEGANPNVIRLQATVEDISNKVEVKGKSTYAEEENIYAPYAAEVKSWLVKDGSQVKKGQELFQLEDATLRSGIDMAKANIRKQQLETKLKNIKDKLSEEQSGQSAELGDKLSAFERYASAEQGKIESQLAEVQSEIAGKELKANEDKLTKSMYKAPVGGIFLFAEVKEPKMVDDRTLIGKIVNTSKLQLISYVSEYEVFKIKPGMDVDIKVDALKYTKLKGKVERVSKFAKTGSDSAQFEVAVSIEGSTDLIAGLSLVGSIVTDKKEKVVVVPTLAVMHENDEYFVYVERNGSIEKKVIKIGLETPDKTEITEGVAEGDTVVLQ